MRAHYKAIEGRQYGRVEACRTRRKMPGRRWAGILPATPEAPMSNSSRSALERPRVGGDDTARLIDLALACPPTWLASGTHQTGQYTRHASCCFILRSFIMMLVAVDKEDRQIAMSKHIYTCTRRSPRCSRLAMHTDLHCVQRTTSHRPRLACVNPNPFLPPL